MYADAHNCRPTFLSRSQTRKHSCMHSWHIDIGPMDGKKNRLKLNEERTEVLYTCKAGFSSQHSLRPFQIGGINILPAENVKSHVVTLDSCLTLNKHMSVQFALLLLCTSETLERFVIFWLNLSLKSWYMPSSLLDWTIVTASCTTSPRGPFGAYSVFRAPHHAWWHATVEMIIQHHYCLSIGIGYQCKSKSSSTYCCSPTKQSWQRAIIFIRFSFKLHSKKKPWLIIKIPSLSAQD